MACTISWARPWSCGCCGCYGCCGSDLSQDDGLCSNARCVVERLQRPEVHREAHSECAPIALEELFQQITSLVLSSDLNADFVGKQLPLRAVQLHPGDTWLTRDTTGVSSIVFVSHLLGEFTGCRLGVVARCLHDRDLQQLQEACFGHPREVGGELRSLLFHQLSEAHERYVRIVPCLDAFVTHTLYDLSADVPEHNGGSYRSGDLISCCLFRGIHPSRRACLCRRCDPGYDQDRHQEIHQ